MPARSGVRGRQGLHQLAGLADPTLITRLAERFGVQCVVVGIDSYFDAQSGQYQVKQFTGDESRTRTTAWIPWSGCRRRKSVAPVKSC
jgi:imidazole glycerol phosphate synthase subunit HisF